MTYLVRQEELRVRAAASIGDFRGLDSPPPLNLIADCDAMVPLTSFLARALLRVSSALLRLVT